MGISFSFSQFIPSIQINQFLPAAPARFYSSAGSTVVAAAIGGAYGFIARILHPTAGISPLHYAIWFALAFQIKEFVYAIENQFEDFLEVEAYLEKLEQTPEDELDLDDLIRYHCWKVIHLKNRVIRAIDSVFTTIFQIRPYDEINEDNVEEASFVEMCRYRIWPVFVSTLLDTASFALAHYFSNGMGFTIPDRTAVPLLIVIRSIVKDIIIVPALYVYARFCNKMADNLEESDERSSRYRAKWIRWCLPTL